MPSTMASHSIPLISSLSTGAALTCPVVSVISIPPGTNLLMLKPSTWVSYYLVWRIDEGVNTGALSRGLYNDWNRVSLKTWLLFELLAPGEGSPHWSHWREQKNRWLDRPHHFTQTVSSLEGKFGDFPAAAVMSWWIHRNISSNSSRRRTW